jgi:hypothetical protein
LKSIITYQNKEQELKNYEKIISLFVFVMAFGFMQAQENFEVSTLRIGPYKIFMDQKEAEKIAGMPLKITDGEKK